MMNHQQISSQDMNNLIMNFFIVEGFKDAAESFKIEANVEINQNDMMNLQDEIRNLIFDDKIDQVFELCVGLDENFFSGKNESLFYELNIQKLIFLIDNGDFIKAIEFATKNLSSFADNDIFRTNLLEKAMTLMAWDKNNLEDFPYPEFLGNGRKIRISSLMNNIFLN